MGRPKTGVEASTADAVAEAIDHMAADRSLPRTASKLAELAGVGRATLYRAFEARPELRDTFNRLVEQSPATERSKLESNLADRLAEIRLLKERITALTSTVEHLLRDNNALRQRLTGRGATIADISQPRRRKESHEPRRSPR